MAMIHTFRKGIAMIELIFALVILGITLMSAPLLVSQATNSSIVTFQQESIAIAAAHTSALMTYAWDEANTGDRATRILSVDTANAALDLAVPPLTRNIRGQGPILIPNSRIRVFTTIPLAAVAPIVLGQDATDGGNNNDVDDFNGALQTFQQIQAGNAANQGEYMAQDSVLNFNITYMPDIVAGNFALNPIGFNTALPLVGAALNSTNIKLLTVNLISVNANTNIQLQAFMCNIGGAVPQSRKRI